MMKSIWLHLVGVALTGFMMAISFPAYGQSTIIFISLVPFLFVVSSIRLKKVFLYSWLTGLIFFGTSLIWLLNTTRVVNEYNIKLGAIIGFILLISYCALYFIPFGIIASFFIKKWAGTSLKKNIQLMFVLTMSWVGLEYFRSIFFTGFSWNLLGISQYQNAPIIQSAELGGVFLISAIILWMNVGVFITARHYVKGKNLSKYRPHYEFMLGILPIAIAVAFGMQKLFHQHEHIDNVQVALIQPNISQEERALVGYNQAKDRLKYHSFMAIKNSNLDLLIWPETATIDCVRDNAYYMQLIKDLVDKDVSVLVGSPEKIIFDNLKIPQMRNGFLNASILFTKDNLHHQQNYKYSEDIFETHIHKSHDNFIGVGDVYYKQHLVPFGEYVPMPDILGFLSPMDFDFFPGSKHQPLLSILNKEPFSILICFEDTVPALASSAVRKGARWIVNQTNDAWFDPSSQSEQHVAHAVFRCVENRVPMVRACNTGVTCIIDKFGRIKQRLKIQEQGFITGSIDIDKNFYQTFYTNNGDIFAKLGAIILLFSLTEIGVKKFRKKELKKD